MIRQQSQRLCRLFVLALALAFQFATGTVTFAQTDQGRITGTVKDQSGAVVTGASVTVRNERTGDERTTTSNEQGIFIITSLKPSLYKITVSSANFSPTNYTSVEIVVGQALSLDVELKPAGTNEMINIIGGDEAALDTSSARMGADVN